MSVFLSWLTPFSASTLALLVALSPFPSHASEEDGSAGKLVNSSSLTLEDLGFSASVRRFGTQPSLDFVFSSRADRLLTGGTIEFVFSNSAQPMAGILGLRVLVNGEELERIPWPPVEEKPSLEIDGRFLGETNVIRLEWLQARESLCNRVEEGAWEGVVGGRLRLRSLALPVASDLSTLPLPWLDRGFDREAEVTLVLPRTPDEEHLRAAFLVAGWLGQVGGVPIRFTVSLGELPDERHAIVLIDGRSAAESLGLQPPVGPWIRIVGDPRDLGAPHRFLVVEGRGREELLLVAKRLASGSWDAKGDAAGMEPLEEAPLSRPFQAKRWVRPGEDLVFADALNGEALRSRGAESETLALKFRLAPDLFFWPREWVDLDLETSVRLPKDAQAPRVDVTFNDAFLGTLPVGSSPRNRSRLRIHRDQVRGYNELRFHVNQARDTCLLDEAPEVVIEASSALRVGDASHFSVLPDLQTFAYDGYPFTRLADLHETTVALSRTAHPREIGSALSFVAWFASITGEAGGRVATIFLEDIERAPPKGDILVVTSFQALRSLDSWSELLPVDVSGTLPMLQQPKMGERFFDALEGFPSVGERRRAAEALERARDPGLLLAARSPYGHARSLVVVTADAPEGVLGAMDLQGYAVSSTKAGDVFISSGGERSFFQVGKRFQRGELSPLTHVRFRLSQRWLLLLPLALAGSGTATILAKRSLVRRERERLGTGDRR